MNDLIYDGTGRIVVPMGTDYTSIEGYTTINTPSRKNLYCSFVIDNDGSVKLEFRDGDVAAAIAEEAIKNRTIGFTLDLSYMPAEEAKHGGQEEASDGDSRAPLQAH